MIAGRSVGIGHPPYIVAELSANHGGSLQHALDVMAAAKAAGADAVKLQTYTADTMTLDHSGRISAFGRIVGSAAPLRLVSRRRIRRGSGIETFSPRAASSAFRFFRRRSTTARSRCWRMLDVPAYKIASFELIDLPLIRRAAAKAGKPTICRPAWARPQEIAQAVAAVREGGGRDLMLLHCVSGYPTPIEPVEPAPHSAACTRSLLVRLECRIIRWESRWRLPRLRSAPARLKSISRCGARTEDRMQRSPSSPMNFAHWCGAPRRHSSHWEAGALIGPKSSRAKHGSFADRSMLCVTSARAKHSRPKMCAGSARDSVCRRSHLPEIIGKRARYPLARGDRLTWDAVD